MGRYVKRHHLDGSFFGLAIRCFGDIPSEHLPIVCQCQAGYQEQTKDKLTEYKAALEGKNVPETLQWALNTFGVSWVALSSALDGEGQALTCQLLKIRPEARIFTLDTGRFFQETYEVMQETMEQYDMGYEVYGPTPKDLMALYTKGGPNLFYKSVEARKKCCEIRS